MTAGWLAGALCVEKLAPISITVIVIVIIIIVVIIVVIIIIIIAIIFGIIAITVLDDSWLARALCEEKLAPISSSKPIAMLCFYNQQHPQLQQHHQHRCRQQHQHHN